MAIPTQEQVKAEIEKLKELKGKVLKQSMFGDSHPDAIQAQIDTLVKGWDEDTIYEIFDDAQDDAYERNNALLALAWRETGELPEDETGTFAQMWESLVRE